MPDYPSRKAYREAQQRAQKAARQAAASRDAQRQNVERAYAREHPRRAASPQQGRLDEVTFRKVNRLKTKLNWAIGIVLVLLVVVALVLFLV